MIPKLIPLPLGWEKIEVSRWQFDGIIAALLNTDNFDEIWTWAHRQMDIRKIPQRHGDVPMLYVYFGYKKDANAWRIERGIRPRDVVTANDWAKLDGRRGRPVPIALDCEWSQINWNHENHQRARDVIYRLEAVYGSVDLPSEPVPVEDVKTLHRELRHPDYEYSVTRGPRKSWNDYDVPPYGDGWERNVDTARNGWDREDYFEESFWRRKKTAGH